MVQEIEISDFFNTDLPLIDVRSPGEYLKGHIPGAANIPLFTDEERTHVGTVYTRQSPEKAAELAFAYVTPKLEYFITESRRHANGQEVAVHCWRGGMRSRSFAEHLAGNGFKNVYIIKGGYKSYRTYLHCTFDEPLNLRIVGGYTGSGKTFIIQRLREKGFQVVDLEHIARHRGSAFGAIGQPEQPTSEQFENDLFDVWHRLDPSEPVWLEDESHNIGGVNLPMNLYRQMMTSPVYFIEIPREERAELLVREYAGAADGMLEESIIRISKRIGGLNTKYALQYLSDKMYYEVAMIVLTYYDKAYLKGMSMHDQTKIHTIARHDTDTTNNTEALINLYRINERNKTHSI